MQQVLKREEEDRRLGSIPADRRYSKIPKIPGIACPNE
jgi:hypothetical protein